jgi:hypothetical protein
MVGIMKTRVLESIDQVTDLEVLVEHFNLNGIEVNGQLVGTTSGDPLPSTDEIEAARQTVFNTLKAREYKSIRGASYPNIRDQLDALYRDVMAGTLDSSGEFATLITNVKNSNPKPN